MIRSRANMVITWLGLALLAATGAAACQRKADASHATDPAHAGIETAVATFLEQRGDLCLGKFDWPIQVTLQDTENRTSDAVQMPVLERRGLVTSTASATGRSYALTELGRRYYLKRKAPAASSDLCAGKIELDRVVAIQPQSGVSSEKQVTVRYTYHFAAAEWVRDAEVQAVFPMLAQIIAGERSMAMELRFTRTDNGWVALDPRA